MHFISTIKDVARTLEGKLTITLEIPGMEVNEITELAQTDKLDVEIKKHKEKRSLDANAYYWLLVGKKMERSNR